MIERRAVDLYEIKLALNYLCRETEAMKLPMVSHFLAAAMEALEKDHGPIRAPGEARPGDGEDNAGKRVPRRPKAHNDG